MNIIKVFKKDNVIEIVNELYPEGVVHVGDEKFPDIGVEYLFLQYNSFYPSECYWVDTNNAVQEFTDEQLEKISKICNDWKQDLGQQGNPTEKQIKEKEILKHKKFLNETAWIWEKFSRNVILLKELSEEEFKIKYNDIILNQEIARSEINRLEIEVKSLE